MALFHSQTRRHMIKEFYCTNTREYTNIPTRPAYVYTLVKLYNKASMFEIESINSYTRGNRKNENTFH